MKLSTLVEQNELTLSSSEKYILLAIHTSQTPVLAFDRIRDSQRDVIASNMLHRYGFIRLATGSVRLTNKGRNALSSYGLVDETGEVTDIGQKIMDNYDSE